MRTGICSVAVLIGAMGIVTDVAAVPENNSSLAPLISDKVAYEAKQWSYANAVYLSGLLADSSDPLDRNNQREAMREFLSLYALTRSDTISGNGTWEELPVKNGDAVRAALFGSGSLAGDLISQVHIGGSAVAGQNPYANMNEILSRLGIQATPVIDHQNHFHIYLNPPTPLDIGPALLLTDNPLAMSADPATSAATLQTEAQGLLDYAQAISDTGEEIMFTMDVPYVPVQDTPLVLVQAATSDAAQQPDYLLKACTEFSSGGGGVVDPATWLVVQIGNREHRDLYPLAATVKFSLLEDVMHGKLIPLTSGTGSAYYKYLAAPDYLGNDKAVFMAEFEGKRYKVIINFVITEGIDENNPKCLQPELIKLNKPSSGSSGFDLNGITVTFADLAGGAVGKTIGEGANATITLDDNAAGNGWFIDTTPADNSN